jgi:hypothetical protein
MQLLNVMLCVFSVCCHACNTQLCIKRSAINGRCEVYSTDKSALAVTPLETDKKGSLPTSSSTKKVSPSVEEPESELITKLKKR